jgi:hypothetical protein
LSGSRGRCDRRFLYHCAKDVAEWILQPSGRGRGRRGHF